MVVRRGGPILALVVAGAIGFAADSNVGAQRGDPIDASSAEGAKPAGVLLANRCFALASVASERFVAIAGEDGYRADQSAKKRAAAFYLKPTRLGTYVLSDHERGLLAVEAPAQAARAGEPGEHAEWALRRSRRGFALRATVNGRDLAVEPGTGDLILVEPRPAGLRRQFELVIDRRCKRFPEAKLGAFGRSFKGTTQEETVFGLADLHLHITSELRAGGRVIHGESFNRFGISRALGGDEYTHGPDGSLDTTGNLLRSGSPVGTHDTHGWPTFAGWPVHDTYTHQQVYYVWLKRVWKAGLRLVVASAVEDEPLCEIEPMKSHSCDETETIKLAIQRLRALQDYVDAQSGGRRRGWFRLVYHPKQARRVIESGRLAVVLGTETSNPLGCSEFQGEPQCTRADIDRRLDELHRWGVRSMFLAHWPDNALAGAALQPGANGDFISAMQIQQTGRPFSSEPCAGADEADGQCNSKGLTDLGRYVVRRMMDKHMLIEVDHLSQKAKATVLDMAEANRYPLVSSHTGTGGEWTPAQLRRLFALGGIASATPDIAPALASKIVGLSRHRSPNHYFGVGLGTDTGGFNSLPGPRNDPAARPLRYPFTSYGGDVRFVRQRSGQRVYDLNVDGVAHYGLFADLIADMQRQRRAGKAMRALFRSAEAYLRMWERAVGRR